MASSSSNSRMSSAVAFRIGISLGDVMVDGDDLFGNGVNVAARMEGLADPGAICVSGNVHEHLGNSLDVPLEDLGEQAVKNINKPIRVYRVSSIPRPIDAVPVAIEMNRLPGRRSEFIKRPRSLVHIGELVHHRRAVLVPGRAHCIHVVAETIVEEIMTALEMEPPSGREQCLSPSTFASARHFSVPLAGLAGRSAVRRPG